jgi:hypothetical protein
MFSLVLGACTSRRTNGVDLGLQLGRLVGRGAWGRLTRKWAR